jgi:hypothetical protein
MSALGTNPEKLEEALFPDATGRIPGRKGLGNGSTVRGAKRG